jgi:DegV family protein with EDD domain
MTNTDGGEIVIKVVTDTTCDLLPEMVEEYDITIVPINIQFGTDSWQEGVNMDWDLFYDKIEETGVLPTTSQPSPGAFAETYRRLAREGADAIISTHVTSKLSGTYQSACDAADLVKDEVKVYPHDSLAGSAALGLACMEASRLARAGKTAEEIIARLDEIRSRINVILVLENLEYPRKSGRVGGLSAALGSLLNLKPIISLEDGLLDTMETVRTRKKSLDRLLDIMEERVGTTIPINLGVIHARAPEVGQEVLSRAKQKFNCNQDYLAELCASLTVHFGPGTIGLCFYQV